MEEWGLAGLFVSCFLAATILPFSSEAVFLLFLATGYEPLTCYLIATLGNSLGGATNLLLGRFGRNWFGKKGKLPRAEHLIRRFGAWTAFFSWVPFVGDPLLVALGFYRTPLAATFLLMIAGKAVRYAVLWYGFSLVVL